MEGSGEGSGRCVVCMESVLHCEWLQCSYYWAWQVWSVLYAETVRSTRSV